MNENSSQKVITKEELLENDGFNGKLLWILIDGKVYDVSTFKHPGGKSLFTDPGAGEDLSEGFIDAGHSNSAVKKMDNMFVGVFKKD